MNYRITIEDNYKTRYSYLMKSEENKTLKIGTYETPFPNEKGNSDAFGIAECFFQSESCPGDFGDIVKVVIEYE